MTLINKVILTILLSVFALGVIGYVSYVYVLAPEAQAVGTCGSCDDTPSNPPSGDDDDGGGDYTPPPPNPPVCDIKTSIEHVEVGQTYRISWTGTAGASYALVNDNQSLSVDRNGWYEFAWDANDAMKMFEINGSNEGGTCSDIVEVFRKVSAPVCEVSVNVTTAKEGDQFTVSWNGTPDHSTAFRINGTLVDAVDSATYTFPEGRTTPVVITFTGDNAKGDCSDTATVHPHTDTPDPAVCDFFTASPTSLPYGGGNVTLEWETTDADSVSIDNGVGSVTADGNETVNVTDDTTFTLTAEGAGGDDHCTASVHVDEPEQKVAQCDFFTASPTSLPYGGGSVTLEWETTDADSVSIDNGVGSVTADGNETVNVTDDTTFTLTATGAGGNDTCTASVHVGNQPNPQPPQCPFVSSGDTTVVNFDGSRIRSDLGESRSRTDIEDVTLAAGDYKITLVSWDGYNGRQNVTQPNERYFVRLFNGNSTVADTGSIRDVTDRVREATMTEVVNNTLSVSQTITDIQAIHTVYPDNSSPNSLNPICAKFEKQPEQHTLSCDDLDFTSSGSQVNPGDTVDLSWVWTSNVSSATVDQGIGAVNSGDTRTVTINDRTTFTTTITDGQQSVQCPLTVDVLDIPEISCDDLVFTASDTLVTPGDTVDLSWVWTGNVSSATVDQGIGAINSGDSRTVTINDPITYTTTITNGQQNVQCPLTINVEDIPTPICEGVSFSANDTTVNEGADVTLNWSWTQSYDEVRIDNGVGTVSNNSSRVVNVDNDESYTLFVTRNGDTESCRSVSIDVDTGGGGGGGGSNAPRCQLFEASDDSVTAGERVVLRWETSRANEITLYEGTMRNGDEIFATDDDDEVDEGEFVVRPTEDTTYTLHLERGSRDRTCKVEVEVDDDVLVLTERNQEPRVAGIALTQVPYTGFEAGPVLTVLFYLLLAFWGLFVAYTFTVKRDRVLGFSLAGAFPRKQSVVDASTDATESEADTSTAAAYVAQTTTATAPMNLPTGKAPTTIGYASMTDVVVDEEASNDAPEDTITDLENRAHAQHALFSSDALRYFAETYALDEQFTNLDALVTRAKAHYPSEDGWVVVNLERLQTLMDVTDVVDTLPSYPTDGGSLAEAIVSGNVRAAQKLIGQRPMVALADATTELDSLYRVRMGGSEHISDLLASASSHLTDAQVREIIHALNTALDGTYSDEMDAVKTAVMKAISVVSHD